MLQRQHLSGCNCLLVHYVAKYGSTLSLMVITYGTQGPLQGPLSIGPSSTITTQLFNELSSCKSKLRVDQCNPWKKHSAITDLYFMNLHLERDPCLSSWSSLQNKFFHLCI
ncbi:hypothetical protein AMTRI_Chr09g31600 [Amborella trichopoda]